MAAKTGRLVVGLAVLLAGIVGFHSATTTAAPEAVADADFKYLVEQDAKHILTTLNNGMPPKKTADRAIKSSALMLAAYAQSRMGKSAADDAKLATLRDAALKVAATGGKKKYADAVAPAKSIAFDMPAAGKVDAKVIDLIKTTEIDMEELMYQFKKTTVGGLGIEEEIKANSKKLVAKPEHAAAIARRTLIVADFCDTLEPAGGFSAAKPKKDWDTYNKETKVAATALGTAAKANNAKDMQAAFLKLDAACVNCHNKFK
jgi:hypothetical protein